MTDVQLTQRELDIMSVLWERGEALARRCEEWLEGARKRLAAARQVEPLDALDVAGPVGEDDVHVAGQRRFEPAGAAGGHEVGIEPGAPVLQDASAFNLSLRVNFADGTSGNTYLRLVGSDGSLDVEWERVVLRRNKAWDPKRAIQKEYMHDPEPQALLERSAPAFTASAVTRSSGQIFSSR